MSSINVIVLLLVFSTAKVSWTENDENELMRLFEDFRDAQNPGEFIPVQHTNTFTACTIAHFVNFSVHISVKSF